MSKINKMPADTAISLEEFLGKQQYTEMVKKANGNNDFTIQNLGTTDIYFEVSGKEASVNSSLLISKGSEISTIIRDFGELSFMSKGGDNLGVRVGNIKFTQRSIEESNVVYDQPVIYSTAVPTAVNPNLMIDSLNTTYTDKEVLMSESIQTIHAITFESPFMNAGTPITGGTGVASVDGVNDKKINISSITTPPSTEDVIVFIDVTTKGGTRAKVNCGMFSLY